MHLSLPVAQAAVHSKAVVLLLVTCCLLLLQLWESVIVLCFVVRYFMSILVLQPYCWGRKDWLLCLVCLPGVLWLCYSSWRCHGFICSLWLWYFLIILTYYFRGEVVKLCKWGKCATDIVKRSLFSIVTHVFTCTRIITVGTGHLGETWAKGAYIREGLLKGSKVDIDSIMMQIAVHISVYSKLVYI